MEKRIDHRQIADEMGIYFLDEKIGAGLPVWLPNGVAIREELERMMKKFERDAGYVRVESPHIGKSDLYEMSGHLRAFGGGMFPPMESSEDPGNRELVNAVRPPSRYYLRPMNCPHHHRVFSSSLRSYRQLPLRIAEYGQVYRYENSGSLRGLSRVRGLCQNDAHIYIDPDDALNEVESVLDLHERCYRVLGLEGFRYRLSKSDSNRASEFDGSPDDWKKCEAILREALVRKGLPFFEADGEGAFYGPKIDVQMMIGVDEQASEESVASVQLDFNSAEKFDLSFVASSGALKRPWIVHRAPLGSHERFVSLLLEQYQGRMPGWLAPVQVAIIPISDRHVEFASEICRDLRSLDIRVSVDREQGSLAKRLRELHRARPFIKVFVGDKEIESRKLELELREVRRAVDVQSLKNVLGELLRAPWERGE